MTEVPAFGVGVRVAHHKRGEADIRDIVLDDEGQECWDVVFDSGDRHQYRVRDAPQKFSVVSPSAVTLRIFRLAALQCLAESSPSIIEALYLLLQTIESGDSCLQSLTDVGVSTGLVRACLLNCDSSNSGACSMGFRHARDVSCALLLQIHEMAGGMPKTEKTRFLFYNPSAILKSFAVGSSTTNLDVSNTFQVHHPTRGPGVVTQIDQRNERGKPVTVKYDNGEEHQYSMASAAKLKVVLGDGSAGSGSGWAPSRVEARLRALCCEIGGSISAEVLHRWALNCKTDRSRMAELFVMSTRLKPHVQDYSDLGVYSKSIRSKIYRSLVERMPKVLMLAAYSHTPVVRSLERFMEVRWISDRIRRAPRCDALRQAWAPVRAIGALSSVMGSY
jgi:hypothetical protein